MSEDNPSQAPKEAASLFNAGAFINGVRILSDFKKKTLISEIFNHELGECCNQGYQRVKKIIDDTPGGIEEKRKKYPLLEEVFENCHEKAKNIIETHYQKEYNIYEDCYKNCESETSDQFMQTFKLARCTQVCKQELNQRTKHISNQVYFPKDK